MGAGVGGGVGCAVVGAHVPQSQIRAPATKIPFPRSIFISKLQVALWKAVGDRFIPLGMMADLKPALWKA